MPFVINETMGAYSELLMLLAAGTYTVAFIAFAWDLAKSSRALRAIDLKAAEAAGAAGAKVPVAAGVGASAGAADSVSTQQTPSRQGDNGPDSVTIPTGSAGPTKDQ
jgi:hypothetical protein